MDAHGGVRDWSNFSGLPDGRQRGSTVFAPNDPEPQAELLFLPRDVVRLALIPLYNSGGNVGAATNLNGVLAYLWKGSEYKQRDGRCRIS